MTPRISGFANYVAPLVQDGAGLAQQVRRLVQVKSATTNLYEQKSGRIHSRALFKVPTGEKNVFKQKVTPHLRQDTAFMILGDASGSMGGDQFYAECASFVLLSRVFRQLSVPYEFLMFTENGDCIPLFMVLKAFDKKATDEELVQRCAIAEWHLGNNPDGEALLWANKRLQQRRERRKILIVLSDGYPATTAKGDAATHLRVVAEQVGKHCELHAIGLMSDSPLKFYKNASVVQSTADLSAAFLNLFKSLIIH